MVRRAFQVVDNIMTDEPVALRAMQRIEDHIQTCSRNYDIMTSTFTDVKNAIKDTNRLLMSFIAFVIVTVVGFASYTYVQNQTLANQLTDARIRQSQAINAIPDVTASKVAAKVAQQQPESAP